MKKNFWKRLLSAILAASMLGSFAVPLAGAAEEEALTVTECKVSSLTDPLGIEGTPLFSWSAKSSRRDDGQSAYRLIVSTSEEDVKAGKGTVWDSGKVNSDKMLDVAYAGPALSTRTLYYWSVTVYSRKGEEATSPVARFSTGVGENEWTGEWIGYPQVKGELTLSGAKWIWLGNGAASSSMPAGDEYFRFSFDVPAGKTVSDFEVAFTADDSATVYLNGNEVGSVSLWNDGSFYRSAEFVKTGRNTLAVKAANASTGNAGLIAKLKVSYSDGTSDTYQTDNTWKVSKTAPSGWEKTDFDDSSWKAPDQAQSYGASPWGTSVTLRGGGSRAATVLRKEFTVGKTVQTALVSLCGLGFFDLTVNGKPVDDSVLNPYITQYDETVYYRTFDLTSLLVKGENALGVELGNAHYNEIGGVWNWSTANWRDDPKLMLRLDIYYTDGTSDTVVSDTSWKTTQDGPITANSMYYGDVYDARKELPGFNTAGYDDSAWVSAAVMAEPLGELEAQMKAPIRRVATFSPEEIVKLGDGSWRVESPEMAAGWVLLKNINQKAGDKITLTYGQKLNEDGSVLKYGGSDGELASWYPHAYFQQDVYYSAGRANESYEPKFSYKGFEYIQIDGYDGELTADDVVIYRVSNDVEIISEFSTSNEMFNRLHKSMQVALADNFQGEHCDPMLEKTGWLGDANVALTSMMFNFDMAATLPGFLEVMKDCQDKYGIVPPMVPTADWNISTNVVWNTVFIYGVRDLEDYFGTASYSEEMYDAMRVMALRDISDFRSNGWVCTDGQLGDWVAPMGGSNPNLQYNENPSEGSGLVGTAFVYGALAYMAELAERLGKTNDVATFQDAMDKIYAAFNKKFYNAEKGYYETKVWNQIGSRTRYRQTSNLVPLAFGLVPEENVKSVVDSLVKDITEKDYHLDTGCVGTRYILPVLCDYGYDEVAYRIATQTTYPSWGFWLENDSKSTWEMWELTTRSFDHYFLGTYDEWYFTHLAGIKEVKNGYETFRIDPSYIGDLTEVNAAVKTVRGRLASSWERLDDNKIRLVVTVPFGSTAEILLPTKDMGRVTLDGASLSTSVDGVRAVGLADGKVAVTVGSGSYTFLVEPDAEGSSVYRITLGLAIDKASGYLEDPAYAASAEALRRAIDAAKAVYEDEDATQAEVNRAAEELESFLLAMVGSESRNALRAAVAASRKMHLKKFYTVEAWRAYRQVLNHAETLLSDSAATDEALDEALKELTAAETALAEGSYVNLALGGKGSASSTNESTEWSWGLALAFDGNRKNSGKQQGEYTGFCSNLTPSVNHEEWLAIDLGSVTAVNTVVFYSSSSFDGEKWWSYGFPESFRIELSTDGKTWTTVREEKEYPLPEYGPLVFDFEETEARYVRLYAESLRPKPSDSNSYRMQISEFEVYCLPEVEALDTAALADAVSEAEALLSDELYTGAAESAQKTFDQALALAKRLLDDEGALQEELDEAVAALDAAKTTLSENRAPEPETPGTDDPSAPGDSGDGLSVGAWIAIGAGAAVVIAAGVVAIVLIRKKKVS